MHKAAVGFQTPTGFIESALSDTIKSAMTRCRGVTDYSF
jgi:hypothetical protein